MCNDQGLILLTIIIWSPFMFAISMFISEKISKKFYVRMINEYLSECTMTNGKHRHHSAEEQVLLGIAERLRVHHLIDQYTEREYPYIKNKRR